MNPRQSTKYLPRATKVEKEPIKLKINNNEIGKDQNPTYLDMQLDRQLLKNHIENLKTKATRCLKLIKKLNSTNWDAYKRT